MNIKNLHQIEITSRCNLRCKYCPHPKMQRAKMDMELDVYQQALSWVDYFVKREGQRDLNLAGIGESTLHPNFAKYVEMARKVMGDYELVLATNGIEITKRPELVQVLKEYKVSTYVSLHRPERAGLAIAELDKAGVLAGVSADPSIGSVDWAGQVDWPVTTPLKGSPCMWLKDGKVIVLSDGRISTCSFDAEGVGVIGSVFDHNLQDRDVTPYSLCDKCHFDSKKINIKQVA